MEEKKISYLNSKENIQELVNEWDKTSELIDIDPMRPIRYAKALRYLKNLDKRSKILEVGCGNGKGLEFLYNKGFTNLTGVEVSPDRINRAKAVLPSAIDLRLIGPNESLPFSDNYFDAIISCAVIEHTINPKSFMDEISRILCSYGDCVISSDCFTWRILQLLGIYNSQQPIDKTYTISSFRKIFNDSGFALLHTDTFNLPQRGSPYAYYGKELFHSFLKKVTLGKWNAKGKNYSGYEDTNLKIAENILREDWKKDASMSLKIIIRNNFFDENIFYLKKRN